MKTLFIGFIVLLLVLVPNLSNADYKEELSEKDRLLDSLVQEYTFLELEKLTTNNKNLIKEIENKQVILSKKISELEKPLETENLNPYDKPNNQEKKGFFYSVVDKLVKLKEWFFNLFQ